MSLPQVEPRYTIEEYLALERKSEERHEYLDGQIYAMAGESSEHGTICMNLSRIISSQLLGTPCQAGSKDMKVRSGPLPPPKTRHFRKGLFSYPDLVAVCGGLEFHDQHRDVLLNPTLIIEVLSPTTERRDRGEKFLHYRTHLTTLTDYVLVSQDFSLIDHFRYQSDGKWVLSTAGDLKSNLHIASINCTLRLSEVYDRVSFPEERLEPPIE